MPDHLLDSGILIRFLRKYPGYREMIRGLETNGSVSIASITRIEVIQGMRDHERERTYELLDAFQTLSLNIDNANGAGELIRSWRKKGVRLEPPDAIIAASAIRYQLELVTTNSRHFPMDELTVWQADEIGNINPR